MDDPVSNPIFSIVSAAFLGIVVPAVKGLLKKRSSKGRDLAGFLAAYDLAPDPKNNIHCSLESKNYFGTSVPRAVLDVAARSPDPDEFITRYLTAKGFLWADPKGRIVYRGWVEDSFIFRWIVALVCTLAYIGTIAGFAWFSNIAIFGPFVGKATFQGTLYDSIMAFIFAAATPFTFLLFRGFISAVILRTYMRNHTTQDKESEGEKMVDQIQQAGSDGRHSEEVQHRFRVYSEYNKLLRTWMVVYGIGAPITLGANDTLHDTFSAYRYANVIVWLFLVGVLFQVIVTFINKWAAWQLYVGEYDGDHKEDVFYKIWAWVSDQPWVDFLADLVSFCALLVATAWAVVAISSPT